MLSALLRRCTFLPRAPSSTRRWAFACGRPTFLLLFLALVSSASAVAAESAVSVEGPDITIIEGKERTVYEYRQSGQLRMIRVVPKWGKPYYLVPRDPTSGFGDLERADMLVPSWVIAEF